MSSTTKNETLHYMCYALLDLLYPQALKEYFQRIQPQEKLCRNSEHQRRSRKNIGFVTKLKEPNRNVVSFAQYILLNCDADILKSNAVDAFKDQSETHS